jgi:hypothetical protein
LGNVIETCLIELGNVFKRSPDVMPMFVPGLAAVCCVHATKGDILASKKLLKLFIF